MSGILLGVSAWQGGLRHQVSQLAIGGQHVVTASSNGHIWLWSFEQNERKMKKGEAIHQFAQKDSDSEHQYPTPQRRRRSLAKSLSQHAHLDEKAEVIENQHQQENVVEMENENEDEDEAIVITMQPRVLLLARKVSISALMIADHASLLLTADTNGEISKWSLIDGRCLQSNPKV